MVSLLKTVNSDDHLCQLLQVISTHVHNLADQDAVFYTLFQYLLDIIIKFFDKFSIQTILKCFKLLNDLLDNRHEDYFILPGISIFSLGALKIIKNKSFKCIIGKSIQLLTRVILTNRNGSINRIKVDKHNQHDHNQSHSHSHSHNQIHTHNNDKEISKVLQLFILLQNDLNNDALSQLATDSIPYFSDNIEIIKILLEFNPTFIDSDLAIDLFDQIPSQILLNFIPIEAILVRLDKLLSLPSFQSLTIPYNSDYELEIVKKFIEKQEWIKAAFYAQSPMAMDLIIKRTLTNAYKENDKLNSQIASILLNKNCKSKELILYIKEETETETKREEGKEKGKEIKGENDSFTMTATMIKTLLNEKDNIDFVKEQLVNHLSHPLLYSSKRTLRLIELLKRHYHDRDCDPMSLVDHSCIRWDQIRDEKIILELLSVNQTIPIHFINHDNEEIREKALESITFTCEKDVYRSWPLLLSLLRDESLKVREKSFIVISKIFGQYPEFMRDKAVQMPLNNLIIRPAVFKCYTEMIRNVRLKHGFVRRILENLIKPIVVERKSDYSNDSSFLELLFCLDLKYGDHTWYYLNYLCQTDRSIINTLYNK